jgi:hypothetical protein
VAVEHGPTHEHERQQERGLDTQHARRRCRSGPAPQRLDQRDAAGDADGEHDDRYQALRGKAPVTVPDEDAQPDGVPAHVGDEQTGEREKADGVDRAGHHRQRERDAVGSARDLDVGTGHVVLPDRRAP